MQATNEKDAMDNLASDMERELVGSIDAATTAIAKAPQLRPIEKREPTISEQLTKMEQIDRSLRDRIRRELLAMQHDFERRAVELRNDYERRISDAVTALEKQRSAELAQLNDDYNSKAREHELLLKRMG